MFSYKKCKFILEKDVAHSYHFLAKAWIKKRSLDMSNKKSKKGQKGYLNNSENFHIYYFFTQ